MVRDDDVDVLVADDVERFGAVRREEQIELAPEHDPHRVEHALLVVDEQEPRPGCSLLLRLHALDRFLERLEFFDRRGLRLVRRSGLPDRQDDREDRALADHRLDVQLAVMAADDLVDDR